MSTISPATPAIALGELTFSSGGRPIRVTTFLPAAPAELPSVLVIHGASGLDSTNRYVRQVAEAWAAQGFQTFMVHYFDRTDTTYANDALIYKEYDRWLGTIHDAVDFIFSLDSPKPKRLGLIGYSLGGYLAMAQAVRDPRIGAVVEIAGGIDEFTAQTAAEKGEDLPPALLIHGEADRRVPFTEALKIQTLLQRLEAPHETRFYPGEGHLLSATAAFDALDAGVEFFRRKLG